MSHLNPYITDPIAQVGVVISAAMGSVPTVDGIHAGLGLADYGVIQFLDKDPVPVFSVSTAGMTDAQIGAKIKEAVDSHPKSASSDPKGALPWSLILPFVFDLLKRWLKI